MPIRHPSHRRPVHRLAGAALAAMLSGLAGTVPVLAQDPGKLASGAVIYDGLPRRAQDPGTARVSPAPKKAAVAMELLSRLGLGFDTLAIPRGSQTELSLIIGNSGPSDSFEVRSYYVGVLPPPREDPIYARVYIAQGSEVTLPFSIEPHIAWNTCLEPSYVQIGAYRIGNPADADRLKKHFRCLPSTGNRPPGRPPEKGSPRGRSKGRHASPSFSAQDPAQDFRADGSLHED